MSRSSVVRLRPAVAVAGAAIVALCATGLPARAGAAITHPRSVIVYGCPGTDDKALCAIDPDGGSPRTLSHRGYLGGVTADGTQYMYYEGNNANNGGIYEASVAGGPAKQLQPPRQYYNPLLSPDGQYIEADGSGNQPNGLVIYEQDLFAVSGGPNAAPTVADQEPAPGQQQGRVGWLGGHTLLTLHAGQYDTPPSWVCIGNQNGSCAQGATTPQLQSSSQVFASATGSADGTKVAATIAAPGYYSGSIGIYDARTGAPLDTITPPAGESYDAGAFSPDGTQIEIGVGTPTGSPLGFAVADLDGSDLHMVVSGPTSSGYWGGSTTLPRAPVASVALPSHSLRAVRRTGALRARASLAGAGTVTIRATISGALARRLHLTGRARGHAASAERRHRSGPVTLAHASRAFRRRGSATLILHLARRERRALHRARRLPITLRIASTATGEKSRHSTRSVVLR